MVLRSSRALAALLVTAAPVVSMVPLVSMASMASAVVAVALVDEPVAHADPSAGEKEAARKQMLRGLDQRKSGALTDALESFRAADAIMHVPTTALEVARTQQALGHWLDARETAAAALRLPARTVESAPFKDARAQMTALIADVGARLPSVTVTVSGGPPGTPVTVTLDGIDLPPGALETPRKVDPGHHVVDGKAGETVGHLEIDVTERQAARVDLVMRGGSVTLTPSPDQGAAGATRKKTDPLLVTEIVGFAGGGAALVTGAVTGIVALAKTSSIRTRCGGDTCPASTYNSIQSDRVLAHTMANVSTIAFIVAGAGAALGVTTFIVRSHRKPDATSAQGSWLLAPGVFTGTF